MTFVRASLLVVAFALATACGADADKATATAATVAAPAGIAATPVAGAALTEAQVRETIDAAEAASRDSDVDRVAALLADDVQVTMSLPASAGVPAETLGRDDMVAEMRKALANTTDRAYTSRIGDVRMAADGANGTVDVTVTESFVNQGHRIAHTSTQVDTVALRGGVPKIVSSTWNTTSLTIDGAEKF